MQRIADSFSWPFRAAISRWIPGVACVLLLPVLFLPLLGYAVAATRAAELEPSAPPPAWSISARLIRDGFWIAVAILVSVLPFALLFVPLADALGALGSVAGAVAFFMLALPWGLVALLLVPHATAAFASSGRPRDLFDVAASLRGVRSDFATWNVAVGAIVTAWAIALACVGVLCAGIVPGVFYAILVSAHACAALARQESPRAGSRPDPSPR